MLFAESLSCRAFMWFSSVGDRREPKGILLKISLSLSAPLSQSLTLELCKFSGTDRWFTFDCFSISLFFFFCLRLWRLKLFTRRVISEKLITSSKIAKYDNFHDETTGERQQAGSEHSIFAEFLSTPMLCCAPSCNRRCFQLAYDDLLLQIIIIASHPLNFFASEP